MSSSLDSLMASFDCFDEEPAPRPSSTLAVMTARHCYENSIRMSRSWIASSASSTAASSASDAPFASASAPVNHEAAVERNRQWNSNPMRSQYHEQPRVSSSCDSGVSDPRTNSSDTPDVDVHGGFDFLFGSASAHQEAATVVSSFGYQPQSQRVRPLFPVEGYQLLETMQANNRAREAETAALAASASASGSIDSDDDIGDGDGDSIATIGFISFGEDCNHDDDHDDDERNGEDATQNEGPTLPSEESTGGGQTTQAAADSVGALRQWLGSRSAHPEEVADTQAAPSPPHASHTSLRSCNNLITGGMVAAHDGAAAADALRQWLRSRSANVERRITDDATSGERLAPPAQVPSPLIDSTAVSPVAPTSGPPTDTLPRRARRQAAISCLERISTAIATGGMGGYHSSDEEEANVDASPYHDMEDRKPTARISNRIRKRNHACKTREGKKRKCEQQEPPTKQPEESEAPSPCCICLEIPTPEDLASISGCSHPFCFSCIEKWAERENTCPLCKARFLNIERVNSAGNNCQKSKKVTNRDQRTDLSFMNSLNGIGMFANLDTNGTWPTHIAQLLFSGLGASSINEGFGETARTAAPTRPNPNIAHVERLRAREREAAGRIPYPPHVGFSSRRPSSLTSSMGNRRAGGTANREPFSDFLDRVNAHRQQQEQIQRIRANVQHSSAFASASAGGGASSTSTSYRHTHSPFHHATTTRRTTTTTTTESSSPWTSSLSSLHVHMAPSLRSSSQIAGSSSPLAFSPFGSPSPTSPATSGTTSSAAAPSSIAHASFLGNPFASINITRREEGEEEEEILSTISPASYVQRLRRELGRSSDQQEVEEDILSAISPAAYIQRLRRELERTSEQFQFSTSASTTGLARRTSVTSLNRGGLHRSAFLYSSVRPMRANRGVSGSIYDSEAGRSAETALEIDDSDSDDDDVVEVVAVEAMM